MSKKFVAHTPQKASRAALNRVSAPPSLHSSRPSTRAISSDDLDKAQQAVLQREETLMSGLPRPKEIGGPEGPEPTRYGDWERKGICVDF